jgi:hypothetical protein
MKNEIIEFFQKIESDFSNVISEAKNILTTDKLNDQRAFTLLNILYENIQDDKLRGLIENLSKFLEEVTIQQLSLLIQEEGQNIKNFFEKIKSENQDEYLKLVDFEWKFIGLATIDQFEKNEIHPKVLLKLIFNNGQWKIIETDYAGLKKFQEEVEEALNSFNSTYARRIEAFAK